MYHVGDVTSNHRFEFVWLCFGNRATKAELMLVGPFNGDPSKDQWSKWGNDFRISPNILPIVASGVLNRKVSNHATKTLLQTAEYVAVKCPFLTLQQLTMELEKTSDPPYIHLARSILEFEENPSVRGWRSSAPFPQLLPLLQLLLALLPPPRMVFPRLRRRREM